MMHLPSVRPLSDSEICISGDVTIHPQAVIAPGAILQAAPDSRIVINEGACIGMGSVLNACQGTIEIGPGAVLGAGVLIIGWGKIGKNACLGTASTVFQASVAEMAVITPGSILGDPSRAIESIVVEEVVEEIVSEEICPDNQVSEENLKAEDAHQERPTEDKKPPVVGRVYINNLLYALFPERQSRS